MNMECLNDKPLSYCKKEGYLMLIRKYTNVSFCPKGQCGSWTYSVLQASLEGKEILGRTK